jgi:hypothetical protein
LAQAVAGEHALQDSQKLSLQQLYQSVAPDNAIVHLKQLKWDDIS